MQWFKNIKASDWWVLAIYWIIAAPITYLGWIQEGYVPDSFSFKGLCFLISNSLFDTLSLLAIVFWVFPKIFSNRNYWYLLLIIPILLGELLGECYFNRFFYGSNCKPILKNIVFGSILNGVDITLPGMLLMGKLFFESQSEMLELQKEKRVEELKSLEAQIDPQFLFDNLNIVDQLIDKDTDEASNFTRRLSSMYRYLIRTKKEDIVSLDEEWAFTKDYCFVLEHQEKKQLIVNTNFNPKENDHYFIPPAASQTIIEQLINHKAASYVIDIDLIDNYLCFRNKQTFNENEKTEIDLKILTQKLHLLTNEEFVIQKTKEGLSIKLPLVKQIT